MKKAIKIAVIASALVAVIAVSASVGSQAIIPGPIPPMITVSGFTVTPNHASQTITASWNQASPGHGYWQGVTGYVVTHWKDGSILDKTTATVSGASTTSWTHSNPTAGQKYWYQVGATVGEGTPQPLTSAASATLQVLPKVTSGSFDESTNTITLTASQSLNSAKAANICIHNTLQFTDSAGITYEPFNRCGSSASVSGTTVTVTISGEYSVNATMTSESIGIGASAIQNTNNLWNLASQEIWLTGGP